MKQVELFCDVCKEKIPYSPGEEIGHYCTIRENDCVIYDTIKYDLMLDICPRCFKKSWCAGK